MKTAKRNYLQILLIFLTITLMFPRLALAQVTQLDEIRFFLSNYYAEPVKDDVLNAPTVADLLARLGDPYTLVMSEQDYQSFSGYVEQRYVGIGINLNVVVEGAQISYVIKGSPADQNGLKVGDTITSLDGRSIKGLSREQLIPIVKGPEGSWLECTYLRTGSSYTTKIQRQAFTVPSVTGEMKPFNTGYVQLTSFASETGSLFGTCLDNLRPQKPQAYIVDLRDNGGGYLQTAQEIAGYFIGNDVAMQIYYRNSPPRLLQAVAQKSAVNKPTIVLVNHYTASASESLALALKDHGKAVLIGTQTYGKGCGQQIFPLSSGGYLKMTTTYLLSPLSVSINKIGITPDLLIENEDPLQAALLLLSGSDSMVKDGLIKLNLANQSFYIDTRSASQTEYWKAYGEMLDKAGSKIMIGKAGNWEAASPIALKDRRLLYYPAYQLGNDGLGLTADNAFTLHFPQNIDGQTIDNKVELIASDSGERIPLSFSCGNGSDVQVTAQKNLLSDTSYWLVLHPGIQYANGTLMPTGVVFDAAVNSPVNNGTGEKLCNVLNI